MLFAGSARCPAATGSLPHFGRDNRLPNLIRSLAKSSIGKKALNLVLAIAAPYQLSRMANHTRRAVLLLRITCHHPSTPSMCGSGWIVPEPQGRSMLKCLYLKPMARSATDIRRAEPLAHNAL